MSLIEGIGDEVVEFFIGLSVILIGAVAWWSTRIADRPLIRTFLVFERRSQSHTAERTTIQNASAQTQMDVRDANTVDENFIVELPTIPVTQTQPEQENKPPVPGTSEQEPLLDEDNDSAEREMMSVEEEQSAIVEQMDSDASILRRRRLKFFQTNNETIITPTENVKSLKPKPNNADSTDMDSENLYGVQDTACTLIESASEDDQSTDENDIRIKLKYINDDLKLVNGKLQEQLGDFKRRHFEFELANDKLVRLIFNGHVLQRDELTLQGCGLFDNCVVHCLVHQKRPSPTEQQTLHPSVNANSGATPDMRHREGSQMGTSQGRDWDLGNLFFAIVSFMLGAAWYFRYEYAQLYTVTATVALVGLTGIFTVLIVGTYFPDSETPVQNVRSQS